MVLVSVIIPGYNHAQYLRQRIDSVLNQSYRYFELIILDDCSTDESREIIDEYVKSFPAISFHYNKINSGNPFSQWDYGVKKASGEYIWIAESDDYATVDFLEKSSSVLSANNNLGFVYSNSKIIDENKNSESLVSDLRKSMHESKWSENYQNHGLDEISRFLYLNNTINNVSGVLFRKSKYIEAGYADHAMKYCGDWFLYLRLLLIADVAYIAEPLNIIRFHSRSTSNYYFKTGTYFREVLRIYCFTVSKLVLTPTKYLGMARILLGILNQRLIWFMKSFKHRPLHL
jgi:glycosyltransferase involved in cell wall biosynthesis